MQTVWTRLKPYRGLVALTLGLVLVQALAELGLPTLMAGIIDQGVLGGDQGAIFTGGLAMVAVAAGAALASVGAAWASSRMGAGFGRDLRSAVFRQATALGPDQFQRFGAASLITRTTNDVTQVQSLAVMSLRMMAMAPLMAVGGLVMAFSLDAELALVLAVVVPFLALAIALLATRAMKLFQIVQERIDRLNLVLRESLTGVRVIRAFDRQSFDAQRFDTANLDLAAISLQTQKLMSVVMPGMMFAMSLASVALVWFGGMRIQAGSLQVGGLMAFLQYSTQILFSLMMMSMLFVILPRAAVSARRIAEVLEAPPAPGAPAEGSVPPTAAGLAIEFRNVTFRYPGAEQAALAAVSFVAPAGRMTAIIGGTGSGKSTVLQLVGRFHDATEGQVLVGGLDVKAWDRSALRARIGLSPQQARLFTGTVAENLRWGRPEATTEQMDDAVATAQAQDFVQGLEGGLDGRIDQAGANLSGGQKQRLTMARALVRSPEILLFDDSFSALDAGTDARLRQALAREIQGATVVVVAQRVSTVRDADHIVVLDEGRVAGAGTHETLLESCPVYREIVASQESREEAE